MSSLWMPNRRHLLGLAAGAAGASILGRSAAWAAAPKHGGTLVLLTVSEPPTITGIVHTGVTDFTGKATEGLLTYDFDLNPVPQLATSWKVSADGLSYVFNLRPGVKWHDGHPFTSADVAYSLSAIKVGHPRGRVTFAAVTDIQTPDDLTVKLTLSKPAPFLLTAFGASETPIVPKHLYDGSKPDQNPVNSAPIGTGPFVFKEWVRGSHIEFVRNPNYWDAPKPYVDRLIIRFIADASARSIALETGEAHIGPSTPIPLSDLARFQTLPNIAIERRGYGYKNNLSRIEFNFEKPFFKDVRVRRAFAHAIDKSVIHQTVNYGYGTVIPGPITSTLTKYYEPHLPSYAFDKARAEALLDEAGFPRGADGIRQRITLDPLGGQDLYRRGGEYIKQALAAVGVDVTLRAQDFPTYIKRVYTERDFDFTYHGMSNLFDPTVGVQRLYWSKNFKPGIPFTNGSGYNSPKTDALLEAAAVEIDPAVRSRQFLEFQKQVIEDLPDINVVSSPDLTLYDKRVAGHTVGAEGIAGNLANAHFIA